jgi:hypothetical protein
MMCKIDNCDREAAYKRDQLCARHYYRIRTHGDPHFTKRTPTGTPLEERITPPEKWIEVDRGYRTPCREWQGNRSVDGYGTIKFENKQLKLHRVMYERTHGEIPTGKVVMHLCDNPPCANPDHLKVGTQQENIQDAKRKGRTNAQKNLTPEQVHELRLRYREGERQEHLEREFGIPGGTVSRIVNGIIYRSVPDKSSHIKRDLTQRKPVLSDEKLADLIEYIKDDRTMTDISEELGISRGMVRSYFPDYRTWDWRSEDSDPAGEKVNCSVCGKLRTVNNLARHMTSKRCIEAGLRVDSPERKDLL